MSRRDLVVATVVATIWGLSFVVVKWGLCDMPPLLFAGLRFACVALLAPFLPRPRVPLRALLAYGSLWGTLQFGGLFLALGWGLPAGTTATVAQAQVVFTVLFAAAAKLDKLTATHLMAIALASAGLAVLGAAPAGQLPTLGLLAALCGAVGWALGNVLIRRFSEQGLPVDTFAFFAWACAIPALSLLVLSLACDGPRAIAVAFSQLSARAAGALMYQSAFALVAATMLWNGLLRRYAPGAVAPLTLLVPVIGLLGGRVVFHELVTLRQLLGTALLLASVSSTVFRERAAGDSASAWTSTAPLDVEASRGRALDEEVDDGADAW